MSSHDPDALLDWVVVGAGVHGTHVALRLLDAGTVDRSGIRLVDPNEPLSAFERKCRSCGTRELRSPHVHHVGVDPFWLRDFARSRGREDEPVTNTHGGDRPTVDLFFDHAARLRARRDLRGIHLRAAATDVVVRDDGTRVETAAGSLHAERCVLAVGYGGSLRRPDWAAGVPDGAPLWHVWDGGFDPAAVGDHDHVGIVGGGVTAAQLAVALARPGREVTMLARSPVREAWLEADLEWMHFSDPVEELRSAPPASRRRQRTVAEARADGTVPPYVMRRLDHAVERGHVRLRRTAVVDVTPAGGTVVASCRDGTAFCFDRLVCATGFGSPYEGNLLRRVRTDSTLATGARGAPVLDDGTLRWTHEDGSLSPVAVTGAAAETVLGPFARNVVGARRAASILL